MLFKLSSLISLSCLGINSGALIGGSTIKSQYSFARTSKIYGGNIKSINPNDTTALFKKYVNDFKEKNLDQYQHRDFLSFTQHTSTVHNSKGNPHRSTRGERTVNFELGGLNKGCILSKDTNPINLLSQITSVTDNDVGYFGKLGPNPTGYKLYDNA
jgi:hypothetical protein